MKRTYSDLSCEDIFYLPAALLVALYPDTLTSLANKLGDSITPVDAFQEIQFIFNRGYFPDVFVFHSLGDYLRYVLDFIQGDAPEFSAYFLDQLHQLERPSSPSLRL